MRGLCLLVRIGMARTRLLQRNLDLRRIAKRGEISKERPKKLKAVIEGALEDYVGSVQVHRVGDELWASYPAWRRENSCRPTQK